MKWVAGKLASIAALALTLAVGLGVACGEGEPQKPVMASDELRAQIVEAVRPAGRILHMKARVGESDWIDEKPHTFEIWLDGDGDRFRTENRREWVGGSAFLVAVGVGWEITTYESDTNDVDKRSIPAEYQARLKDPAVFALWYLWSLAMADEWRILEEKSEDGRTILVIEARGIEGLDVDPGSVSATVVELDKDTLWPVRQSDRIILPEGEIREGSLYLFDVVELLSPKDVPDELFSPEAVESLYVTVEEKLEEAKAQAKAAGFALYWPGERYEAEEFPELYLRDVWVAKDASEASLHYAIEMAGFDLDDTVVIRQGPAGEAEFEPPPIPPVGSKPERQESVAVQATQAMLYVSTLQPEVVCAVGEPCIAPDVPAYHRLVLTVGNTVIQVEAVAKAQEGEDTNPFNNGEALMAVAEALVPVAAQP